MLKYLVFILLNIYLVSSSGSCEIQDAGEYLKIMVITGEIGCSGTKYTCDKSFNYDIQSVLWITDRSGHCSVTYQIGAAVSIACGCNNHWSGVGTLDSQLKIQLVQPPPPPPPPGPPSPPVPTPPSPSPSNNPTSQPTPFNFTSITMIIIYVCVPLLFIILLCCYCIKCCKYNHCCNDCCPNCCHNNINY